MKLVQSMPRTVLVTAPQSVQIVPGILLLVCALFCVLYLAINARPAVEGVFAAMNANILSLIGGAAH